MPIWGSMYMFLNLCTCVNRFEQGRTFVFMGHLGFLAKNDNLIFLSAAG